MLIGAIEAAVDIAILRASPGGDRLSAETVLILAFFMDPKNDNESPIQRAQRLNTINKRDRSAQYQDASSHALLKSNNHLWARIRTFKLMIWILTSALTGCWALTLLLLKIVLTR